MAKVDYSRKWLIMASVAFGLFLGTIDGSIVNIALPILERELNTQFEIVQWVVLAYLLTITTLMLSVGRLADMIGKKWLYLGGFIVFTIGSGLCGLSSQIEQLIMFRVLQAVGASMMTSLGTAIITEAFPPEERGTALGISGLMVSIGLISGPTLGGIILGSFSWHWIFFVNLPIGVIGSLMVWRFVPVNRPVGGQRFDFSGATTMFLSLFALLMGLTLGQYMGFSAEPVLVLLLLWVVFMVIFVVIELKSQQPMIDLHMFNNKLFSVNLSTGFLTFIASAGIVLLMPFFLQNIMGYDPQTSGLLLAVVPLATGVMAPIAGRISDRFGTRRLTVVGLIILLSGYAAVSTLNQNTSFWGYVLRFLPVGIGIGVFQSPNNSAIMGSAPRNRLGVASSLLALTRNLGQTIGIAVMGTVWASWVKTLDNTGLLTDATTAPPLIQISAFHNTMLIITAIIAIAVAMSIWALWKERKSGSELSMASIEREKTIEA